VELNGSLEIFGVLSASRVFTVERKCGRRVSGDGVQVPAAEAVAGERWRDEAHLLWPLLERRPDFVSLKNGVEVETEIREDGPKTDASGACPDDCHIERLVLIGTDMNHDALRADLEAATLTDEEMGADWTAFEDRFPTFESDADAAESNDAESREDGTEEVGSRTDRELATNALSDGRGQERVTDDPRGGYRGPRSPRRDDAAPRRRRDCRSRRGIPSASDGRTRTV
jgi:hypothetical protein